MKSSSPLRIYIIVMSYLVAFLLGAGIDQHIQKNLAATNEETFNRVRADRDRAMKALDECETFLRQYFGKQP